MWKQLIHENIVPFKGVTLEPFQIVSEWMPGGDLTGYINTNPHASPIKLVSLVSVPSCNESLSSRQLVDVARGLRYLHLCDVIHGDLKGVRTLSPSSSTSSPSKTSSQIFSLMLLTAHASQISVSLRVKKYPIKPLYRMATLLGGLHRKS